MDLLDKSMDLINLYDIYQDLLTEKQKAYFEQYYFDDFSITEISENLEVSRNAVHDQLKRAVQKIHDLEDKLQLHKSHKTRVDLIQQIQQKNTDQTIARLLEELLKVE